MFIESIIDYVPKEIRIKILIHIIRYGYLDIYDQYFSYIDVNASLDEEGNKVLHIATEGDSVEKIEYFLNKGTNVNSRDDEGYTPLMIAATNYDRVNNLPVIEYLVRHGADVNAKSNDGHGYPLRGAIDSENITVAKYLIHCGAKFQGESGADTSVINCISYMNKNTFRIEFIEYLLERGLDPNGKDGSGTAFIINVLNQGEYNLFKNFVNKGANLNVTSPYSDYLIFRIIDLKLLDLLELILQKGIDQTIKNKDNESIVSYAVKAGSVEGLKIIQKYVAGSEDLTSLKDAQGRSLLYNALESNSDEMLDYIGNFILLEN